MATDPRFLTNADRLANQPALVGELQDAVKDLEGEALALRLMKNGVPAGAAQDLPAVLEHPHTKHRQMVIEFEDYKGTGIPIKLSRTPGSLRRKPPAFGQDSQAVLHEAGYTDQQIATLKAEGTVPTQRRKN